MLIQVLLRVGVQMRKSKQYKQGKPALQLGTQLHNQNMQAGCHKLATKVPPVC